MSARNRREYRLAVGLLTVLAALFAVGAAFHAHAALPSRSAPASLDLPSAAVADPGPCVACRISHQKVVAPLDPRGSGPPPVALERFLHRDAALPRAATLPSFGPRAPPVLRLDT